MGPLDGIRVIELTTMVAGPACGRALADWGATVIKIEPPGGDSMRKLSLPAFAADNVGKLSVVLDLKTDDGLDALGKLLATSDVFVSNFRTQALDRLRLGSAVLTERYPSLVIAMLTAYGSAGPDKDRPGYDLAAYWARSGLAMAMVPEGGMPQENAGPGVGDHTTGTALAGAVSAALLARERHPEKRGGTVSTSLLRMGTYVHSGDTNRHLHSLATGSPQTPLPEQLGGEHSGQMISTNPLCGPYRALGGDVIVLLGMESQRHLPAIAAALGFPEWASDDRFNTRMQRFKNRRELTQLIADAILTKTLAEWELIFAEHDVWYDVSQRTASAVDDPQLIAAGCFVPLPEHPDAKSQQEGTPRPTMVVASPFDFDGRQTELGGPLGSLGEHTADVLASAGVSPQVVARAVAAAVENMPKM